MKYLLSTLLLFGWLTTNAQHQDKVDFTYADVYITAIPDEKKIIGTVGYKFTVLSDVDSVFLDAKNMKLGYVSLEDKVAKYENTGEKIIFRQKFKANKSYTLGIGFEAQPKQTVYFLGWKGAMKGGEQIWTQGQGKYTSHWLPSFDDMQEKIEFDLTIATASTLEVIANGDNFYKAMGNNEAIVEWHFDMEKPMSSYLLAFAIGNYEKKELLSDQGIPIINYYYPEDSLRIEPTYRYTKKIFDFIEEEIGVDYPWKNYKQIPVKDFLYAGMENTTATIFSDGYVIDSIAFIDKNYVNVNAHELAHQWFGNLVTEKDGNHHWLHEGFATYYAYLAEQHIFGDDHFYWKLNSTLEALQRQSLQGEGQSLLDPKASSLTFYEKGSWALFMLRNELGDKAFRKGMKNYLKKFKFKSATVDDFLKEMEKASRKSLRGFRKEWLEAIDLPYEKARNQLAKLAPSIRLLLDVEKDLNTAYSNNDVDFVKYWDKSNSIHLKNHFITQYNALLPDELFVKAFDSDTIPLRQALLTNKTPSKFLTKERLESLLKDDSYSTKESALIQLWQAYPEDQGKYLDKTKDIVGLPNKNIRILWLTLAMLTDNYKGVMTKEYFDELSSYTNEAYSFEIRQGAFIYLKDGFGLNEESLTNLVKATNHHAWQFKKFARTMLDELLKDPDYKARLEQLAIKLNTDESRYLNSKLEVE